jgi:hypothetical protein
VKKLNQSVVVEGIKVDQMGLFRVLIPYLLLPVTKEATVRACAVGATQRP